MTVRSCPIARILARIERRHRTRLNLETRLPRQIVSGQIALEIQKERFEHENNCVTCGSSEGAAPPYRFLKGPICVVAEVFHR
jgi:hypothetical protein